MIDILMAWAVFLDRANSAARSLQRSSKARSRAASLTPQLHHSMGHDRSIFYGQEPALKAESTACATLRRVSHNSATGLSAGRIVHLIPSINRTRNSRLRLQKAQNGFVEAFG